MTENDLKELLDSEAARINSPAFIADDPVQFPHRFSDLRDVEITSLLTSAIAWGNRKMICRDCNKMLGMMDNTPYRFVIDGDFEDLPDGNIHRTFFTANLKHFLRGLQRIYKAYPSLADFALHHGVNSDEYPAWKLVELINNELCQANSGATDSRCLPLNLSNTALKRVNMALRWLVRDDGIVDLGVWRDVLKPSQLFIPLDVHVGDTARELGLLTRKAADRRAVMEITSHLRRFRPDDPVIYDYALFGIGMRL
ncbi:MAG: TIGR02757 family protein [Lachnoclostridium sp.]|nr:TIGR02757 family protein [Lachnoclostridium sp.]